MRLKESYGLMAGSPCIDRFQGNLSLSTEVNSGSVKMRSPLEGQFFGRISIFVATSAHFW